MSDIEPIRQLLEYLARGLVERPDEVLVGEVEEGDALVLELSVGDDDYGNVIGRGGRTAAALRTVIKTAAVKSKRRVFVGEDSPSDQLQGNVDLLNIAVKTRGTTYNFEAAKSHDGDDQDGRGDRGDRGDRR